MKDLKILVITISAVLTMAIIAVVLYSYLEPPEREVPPASTVPNAPSVDLRSSPERAADDSQNAAGAAAQAAKSAREAADSTRETADNAEKSANKAAKSAKDSEDSANKIQSNNKPK